MTPLTYTPVAETWRRVWGDGKFFSRTKISEWRFYRKNVHFHCQNFWWLFLVIDQVFRIFPFVSQIFRIFYYVKCPIWPFPHKNNHLFQKRIPLWHLFFTLFILSRASDNTTSQNIGGRDAWAVPHLKFWGTVAPSPPRSPPLVYAVYKIINPYSLIASFWSQFWCYCIVLLMWSGV